MIRATGGNGPDPLFLISPAFGRAAGGGLGVSAARIAGHLATRYPVRVVTSGQDLAPGTWEFGERDGTPVIEIAARGERKQVHQLYADLLGDFGRAAANPWFLCLYSHDLAFPSALAAGLLGAPLILGARGNDIDLEIFGDSAFAIHRALKAARRVLCVSTEIAAKLAVFCPEARVTVVPNGVDPTRFGYQDEFVPRQRPVIGVFGDIKQKKGLELLLSAIDLDRFELRLHGQLRDDTRRQLHGFLNLRPDCRPWIRVLPFTDDLAELKARYDDVDLVCLPSLHEGMSNVMLEAMSCGKVCVASAVGGALDLLRDGDNGYLFAPRAPDDLARALARAADTLAFDRGEQVRSAARRTILDAYTDRHERKRYLKALERIDR